MTKLLQIKGRICVLPITPRGEMLSQTYGRIWHVNKDGTISARKGRKHCTMELRPDFVVDQKLHTRSNYGVTYRGMPVERERELVWHRG